MILTKKVDVHLENRVKSREFFFFLWIMYAVVHMTKNSFGAAMASIVSEGILTKSQTGLITAVFYAVYAPLQVVGGMLADRYSPERLIKIGLTGAALVNLLIFFNHNYYVILTAWTFNAVIQTPIWPAVFKIMSSQLVRSDRANMVFLISFTGSFGLILGYAIAAFIPSWQYNFLLSAVILLICAMILDAFCLKLDPYIKPDKKERQMEEKNAEINSISTWKLFLISGFLFLLPSVLLRATIENGIKLLSPVMMMESYSSISASTGNLLNLFIIASGMLGTIFSKFVLYPKIIKNELTGTFALLILAIPFCFALRFVGIAPIYTMIVSLCVLSVLLTAINYLTSHYNMRFSVLGKNGVAAGTSNAAGSLGVMLQSYGFVYIAEKYSWNTVATSWIVMIGIAIISVAIAMSLYANFRSKGRI